MLNRTEAIGCVTADPEIKTNDVVTFTLAVNEKYKGKDGEIKENTEFLNCVAFKGISAVAQKYVKKGARIYIDAKFRTDSYTDKSGNIKKSCKFIINKIILLSDNNYQDTTTIDQGVFGFQYFMSKYILNYTSSRSHKEHEYIIRKSSMREAVKTLLSRAAEKQVILSKISVSVKNSSGMQRFCDKCFEKEASYGVRHDLKNYFVCKECRDEHFCGED